MIKHLYVFLLIIPILLAFTPIFNVMSAESELVETEEITEVEQVELPPAVQEFLRQEMEKLPPLERHYRMAQEYHARKKYDEAEKELEEALKIDPKHVPSQCELGVIYMGKGDYDKAIKQLNKTLKLDPDYPKTHYALANAYALKKPEPDINLARKHLDTSIKLGYHAVPWFVEYVKKIEIQEMISSLPSEAGSGAE